MPDSRGHFPRRSATAARFSPVAAHGVPPAPPFPGAGTPPAGRLPGSPAWIGGPGKCAAAFRLSSLSSPLEFLPSRAPV
ncbi:MAG: hypothetical protein EHM65_01085 [Acidobacteriales bacterium]|nr:MAG: hypothetical protein EHM65_01085 [Terriglobales bacterium]